MLLVTVLVAMLMTVAVACMVMLSVVVAVTVTFLEGRISECLGVAAVVDQARRPTALAVVNNNIFFLDLDSGVLAVVGLAHLECRPQQCHGVLEVAPDDNMAGGRVLAHGQGPYVQVMNLQDSVEVQELGYELVDLYIGWSFLHEDADAIHDNLVGGEHHQESEGDGGDWVGKVPVATRPGW